MEADAQAPLLNLQKKKQKQKQRVIKCKALNYA